LILFATSRRSPAWQRRPCLETNLSFPAKTVPEFIAYAKANPGKINMASVGVGAATPFLAGELFKAMTGVEWVWVQYRSSYMPDLISGEPNGNSSSGSMSYAATLRGIGTP
jgi:tripartite-type tricarboxylate transporter receptor subunit TctC